MAEWSFVFQSLDFAVSWVEVCSSSRAGSAALSYLRDSWSGSHSSSWEGGWMRWQEKWQPTLERIKITLLVWFHTTTRNRSALNQWFWMSPLSSASSAKQSGFHIRFDHEWIRYEHSWSSTCLGVSWKPERRIGGLWLCARIAAKACAVTLMMTLTSVQTSKAHPWSTATNVELTQN